MKEHRVREILLMETPAMEKRIFERVNRRVEEISEELKERMDELNKANVDLRGRIMDQGNVFSSQLVFINERLNSSKPIIPLTEVKNVQKPQTLEDKVLMVVPEDPINDACRELPITDPHLTYVIEKTISNSAHISYPKVKDCLTYLTKCGQVVRVVVAAKISSSNGVVRYKPMFAYWRKPIQKSLFELEA